MNLVFDLLLITHLLALVVGTTTAVAMPLVMGRLAGAGADARQAAGGIAETLSRNSRIAFGVLLLTGIAMVWLRYGGVGAMNGWFWIKMGLIVIVLVALALPRGTINPRAMVWVTRLSLAGIIISAVLAFH